MANLCIPQVSVLTDSLEMALGHNVHACSLTCTAFCFTWFWVDWLVGSFKDYKENLPMWNWKNLNPEHFQKVNAEFSSSRDMISFVN